MPETVLVADHGVAAVQVLHDCQAESIKAVSVHTAADADAPHAVMADESVLLGPELSSYDDVVALVEAARQAGADAVHPAGRELPGLEQAVRDAGLDWLGP